MKISIYRKVEQQVFILGKVCYLVVKKSAILIYKQTILPHLHLDYMYTGFVLVSCNIGQRNDLQILQNNALR